MTRPRRLHDFEALEDRSLPSTFGVPWADPNHLTLSFTADGTATPLGGSTLGQTLAGAGTTAAWQREILRAFQTWAAKTNIDIGLVADGGQALGSLGAVQTDNRFGDIRVAAAPLSPGVVASTSPFSWTGTTLSGDMVFNALKEFVRGDKAGAYDLFSVALHEAGHAYGLDHSDASGSAIGESYAYRTGLSSSDIAAIRALYGTRLHDTFDRSTDNNALSRADALPRVSGSGQLLAVADLTTQSDVDFYKFTAPALTATLSSVVVRLKSSGISLLTASVTVYDSLGRVVGSDISTNPLNNDLMVSFRPGLFGGTYYVKVDGAGQGAFDVGGYKLAVDFLSVGGLLAPLTSTVEAVLDGHTDDVLASALGLSAPSTTDSRFDAIYRGVIEDARDVDTYRITTGKFAAGTAVTLDAMAWGLDGNPLDPRLRIFDESGNPVAFQVLANDTGLFSLQVPNAIAGRDYYIQVAARAPGGANDTGLYFVAADFNRIAPLKFDGVVTGTVAPGQATPAALTIDDAGVFHFSLAPSAVGGDVTMSVYDSNGELVFSLRSTGDKPAVTATSYLASGTYSVRYSTSSPSPAGYNLYLLQLSEGVGPYATSTSSPQPGSGDSSSTSSNYTYSGSSTSQPSGYGYTF
jgi:matrixin